MTHLTRRTRVGTAVAALLLSALTACGGTADTTAHEPGQNTQLPAPPDGLSRVILLGDSVAAGQGEALGAALGVADIEFSSMASDGGGAVVGPVAEDVWSTLPDLITSAKPSTVIYQVTTYDWGTEQEQRAGYQRLVDTVTGAGAQLVLISTPPIVPDDFYAPHMSELDSAQTVARTVAQESDGSVVFLDASQVWGAEYQREREGVVERSEDGIHTCPQGAARFTVWLLDELTRMYPEFDPPAPESWVDLGWSDDEHFMGC